METSTDEKPKEIRSPLSEARCPVFDSFIVLAGKDLALPETCLGESGPNVHASMSRAIGLASVAINSLLPWHLREHGFEDVAKAFEKIPTLGTAEGMSLFDAEFTRVTERMHREATRHVSVMMSLSLAAVTSLQETTQALVSGNFGATLFSLFQLANVCSCMAAPLPTEARQSILNALAESIPVTLEFVRVCNCPKHSDGNHNVH